MDKFEKIKVVKNISKLKKKLSNSEIESINTSSSHSLSFIQCGDGKLKRIRNKTSYKEIYLEHLNFTPNEIPFYKERNLSFININNNKIFDLNNTTNTFYSNPSRKNLKSQSFLDNIIPLSNFNKIKKKKKNEKNEKLLFENLSSNKKINNENIKNDIFENRIKGFKKIDNKNIYSSKIKNVKNKIEKKENYSNKIIDISDYKIENDNCDEEKINSKLFEKFEQLSIELNDHQIQNSQEIEIDNDKIINTQGKKKFKFEPKKKNKEYNNLNEKNEETHNENNFFTFQNSKITSNNENEENENKNNNNNIKSHNIRYNEEEEKNLYSLSFSDNKNKYNMSKENSPILNKQSRKFSIVSNDSVFNNEETKENLDNNIINIKEIINLENKIDFNIESDNNNLDKFNIINNDEYLKKENIENLNSNNLNNNIDEENKKSINLITENNENSIKINSNIDENISLSNNDENEEYDEERVRVFDEVLKDNSKMNIYKNSNKEQENENDEGKINYFNEIAINKNDSNLNNNINKNKKEIKSFKIENKHKEIKDKRIKNKTNITNNIDNSKNKINNKENDSFNLNIKNKNYDDDLLNINKKKEEDKEKKKDFDILIIKNISSENNSNNFSKDENKFNEKKLKISPQIINSISFNKKKENSLKINQINFSIKETQKKNNNKQKIKNTSEEYNNKNISISSTIQKIQKEIGTLKINNNNYESINNNNNTNSNSISPLTPSERNLINDDFITNKNNIKDKNINEIMEPNFISKNSNINNLSNETNDIDDLIQLLKLKNQSQNITLSSLIEIRENELRNKQKNEKNISKMKIENKRIIEKPFLYGPNYINNQNQFNNFQRNVIQKQNIISNHNSNSSFPNSNIIHQYHKSYKNIFEMKDININNNAKYNDFNLIKFENLSYIPKNKSTKNIQDFYKEKENNQLFFKKNNINIPKDKYLNKVKEDIKIYKKNKKKKQEINFKLKIPIQKNILRSNTLNSLRKRNSDNLNIVMPANTLENIIDAKAQIFSNK